MKILILGGYGTFGRRLVRLLAGELDVSLIVAGRSLSQAQAFCDGMRIAGAISAAAVDRNGDLQAAFAALSPDLVVDASGPFQVYGDDPYRVVKACVARGISYLDLADGSAFVEGVAAFDAAAKAKGIFVLSGASTFPALSTAIVHDLSQGWTRVRAIDFALAPSPRIDMGLSVIRAIASYTGRDVALTRGGRIAHAAGLIEARRATVGAPGLLPLDSRRFVLADVPDLRLAAAIWPGLEEVWMGVGTLPAITLYMLTILAWLVRLRLLRGLDFLAPLFHWTQTHIRWGAHRGGMRVIVRGDDASGAPAERSWHLIAEGDDGPFIPAMAAAALIGRRLRGEMPASGARAALRDLALADFTPLFARFAIRTGIATRTDAGLPLYRRFFSDAWDALPGPIRAMHDGIATARGFAVVERGRSLPARWIASVMRFPSAGNDVPVEVSFRRDGAREIWTRTFAGRPFSSAQFEGAGRSASLMEERFGPLTFGLAMVIDGTKLRLVVRRWRLFGVPLPRVLGPIGETFETVDGEGRFRFHVEIGFPWTGLIVRYRGWLKPER